MKSKTLPVFAFLIFCGSVLHAQVPRGSILLGGSFGYNSTDYYSFNTTSNANISPRISYTVGKNSVIGLMGNFSHGVNKSKQSDDKVTNTSYGTALSWKQFFPIQNKLGWYTELSGGIGGATEKSDVLGGNTKTRFTTFSTDLIPGVYFQALPRLLINANVGGINYYRSKQKANGSTSDNIYSSFKVGFLSSFNFGVDFILGKKAQS